MEINTKEFYRNEIEGLKKRVDMMAEKPSYTCYIVSDAQGCFNSASERYVSLKHKTSEEVGINCIIKKLTPKDFAMDMIELASSGERIVAMLQLPSMPCCVETFQNMIDAGHIIDADHLEPEIITNMWSGDFSRVPGTPKGVIKLLKSKIDLTAKKVAVIGSRSKTTGQYLIPLLQKENATVSLYHSKSKINHGEFQDYDIIISCVGIPGMIGIEHLGNGIGKICVDVGVSIVDGKARGDFSDSIRDKHYYTPWVNGMGAITRCMLASNVVEIWEGF
ncbi:MAG: hypothetical protein ACRCZ0_09405 [Cetobacterium sp.]